MYKNATSTLLLPFLLFQLFVIISTAYKYKRTTYQWEANLHRSTGVATSFEQSIFKSSTLTSTLSASNYSQKNIIIILQEIFSRYPKYLSRPSLTFGLCKTSSSLLLPSSSSITNNLQSSILNLNLLSFGTPSIIIQSSSSSSKKKLLKDTKYCQSINSMNDDDDNVTIICCVEIPIVGGLLANTNKIDCKEEVEDNGCLRFTFLQQQQQSTTPQSTNNNNHDNQITTTIVITTQIAGNYRPTIACGTSSSSSRLLLPISKFRKLVYCSTQRMVHTYVMWRYHDHVVNEYMKKILMKKKKKKK